MYRVAERSLEKTVAARTSPETKQYDEGLMRKLPMRISRRRVSSTRDNESTKRKYVTRVDGIDTLLIKCIFLFPCVRTKWYNIIMYHYNGINYIIDN